MEFQKISSFEELDEDKFCDLVKSGFGRALVSDYFTYCKPLYIITCDQGGIYVGAIVVESIPNSKEVHYLDKIVVLSELKGNGIGKILWALLNGDSSKLVWRAKKTNPINPFYLEQCEGLQRMPDWNIYWYGLSPQELEIGISYCLSKKPTLEEN